MTVKEYKTATMKEVATAFREEFDAKYVAEYYEEVILELLSSAYLEYLKRVEQYIPLAVATGVVPSQLKSRDAFIEEEFKLLMKEAVISE